MNQTIETTQTDDDFYPDIGINIQASVEKIGTLWGWKIKTHIAGPDDKLTDLGGGFGSKKAATESMLKSFLPTIKKQLDQA